MQARATLRLLIVSLFPLILSLYYYTSRDTIRKSLWSLFTEPKTPVHFTVASHDAQPFERVNHLTKPEELLTNAGTTPGTELLQSSFVTRGVDISTVFGTANGFVDTVITAYNGHHHLVLKFANLLACIIDLLLTYYQTGRCLDCDP